MTVKIGYARVSTKRQNIDPQIRALKAAGCHVIFSEWTTGIGLARRGLAAALASCKSGDELVVWKIDRLGRDLFELVQIADLLKKRRITLRVLAGKAAGVDIRDTEDRVMFAMYAAAAEIEYGHGRDRASLGRTAVGKRGRRANARSKATAAPSQRPCGSKSNSLRCAFHRSR